MKASAFPDVFGLPASDVTSGYLSPRCASSSNPGSSNPSRRRKKGLHDGQQESTPPPVRCSPRAAIRPVAGTVPGTGRGSCARPTRRSRPRPTPRYGSPAKRRRSSTASGSIRTRARCCSRTTAPPGSRSGRTCDPRKPDLRYLLRRHIAPHFEAKTVAEVKGAAYPPLAQAATRLTGERGHDSEGIPADQSHSEYRCGRRDHPPQPMPHQGRWPGESEGPVLTIPEVFALAEVIDPRYSALVLLGTFGSLRWGELAALRRRDIDLSVVHYPRRATAHRGCPAAATPTGRPSQTPASARYRFPNLVVPRIRGHLSQFTMQDPEAPVFTAPTGTPLRHGNFRRRFWLPALKAAGLPAIHFHDLRHTGNTLTADAGANLRELMERMGHSTTRSALSLPPLDQRASAGHR